MIEKIDGEDVCVLGGFRI